MKRRNLWRLLSSRKRGGLAKLLLVTTVAALAGGWLLAELVGEALSPPGFHQDLHHFRRNRSLAHYLDAIQVLIEPSSTACDGSAGVPLLALVTSSPLRFAHRQAVRSTWAKHLPTYFFMGLNGPAVEDLMVDNYLEAKLYSDVIVFDFTDHYQNLTLKTALMMQWTLARCPGAVFVLKTDDDVLVNPWTMGKVLEEKRDAALVGYRKEDTSVHRDERNKWYLPRWLHHGDRVPEYLSGTGYLVNGCYIKRILEAAHQVPLVNLEDVYLTYLVAREALGLELVHDPRLSPYRPWLQLACAYWGLASAHSLGPEQMLSVWPVLRSLGEEHERSGEDGLCNYYTYLSSGLFLI